MKTSLDHLPLPKQEQLRAITALIRAGAPVEMLVLFGSHARGDWVSDPSGPYFSDYDLMAVVREPQVAKDEALWASLEQQAQAISGRTPVSLIAHDIKHINKELRDAQYFFSDVFTEGILLYDSRGVHLAKVRAGTKEERLRYAERGFAYWFDSASVFLQGCAVYMQSGHLNHAAFCLHQAAERYYHAVMLVFTNYKAKIHNLEQLGEQAAALHPDLHESLPKTTEEDRHLFSLLKRAYIESRYSMSFRISQEELVVLKERVRRLGQLVRRLSIERLETYLGPEAVSRDLPDVPPEEAALAGDLPPAPEEEVGGAAAGWGGFFMPNPDFGGGYGHGPLPDTAAAQSAGAQGANGLEQGMRHFHSYGPVDPQEHYCVPRRELISRCVDQLIGNPEKGGHYFTIWAPRQTGKTWLMRQAMAEVQARFGDRFLIGALSMQGVIMTEEEPPEAFLRRVPMLFRDGFDLKVKRPRDWESFKDLFSTSKHVFDRPLILLIDEFDRLPAPVIDRLVGLFRDVYLNRQRHLLHGLALVGVRAVLGVDSPRGSPFNVQRSLHVPNLTADEVSEMFRQYEQESGQTVTPKVVSTVYEMTRGQPGLVGWFGELLTEKYNPGPPHPIDPSTWVRVYAAACQVEPNNTMLNLLKKATGPFLPRVLEIFGHTDVPFSFGQEWCNYLYLNGIIDTQETTDENGLPLHVCRFSSPFVQQRLFNDLSAEVVDPLSDLPLDPLDTLADVFTTTGIDVPALLGRYAAFLSRLHKKGKDPWKGQPRRADLQLTEAVGHFHLYNWLCAAVGKRCQVSPEFPTGNGTVDLVLRWQGHTGIIEVKSFVDRYRLGLGQEQAAQYAVKLGVPQAALAVFIPITDEEVLRKLSGPRQIGAVTVTTVAFSWTR